MNKTLLQFIENTSHKTTKAIIEIYCRNTIAEVKKEIKEFAPMGSKQPTRDALIRIGTLYNVQSLINF